MQATRRQIRQRHLSQAAGFSLIELMVSLTIGLVIALAAMSAYLGAASSSKMSEAQSRMNEDAQAALNILAQQIRTAGTNPAHANRVTEFLHNPVYDPTYVGGTVTSYANGTTSFTVTTAMSAFAIRGCDGTFSNITTVANLDSFSNCGTSTAPDSIAVSYEADRYNTVPNANNEPTACVGNSIATTVTATFPSGTSTPTTANFRVADNRFYISTSAANVPSLSCKGNDNSTSQPLVENVEDMQFTYGTVSTSATSTTATVAGYLTAAEVNGLAATYGITNAAAWGKVMTVRICVVVRSEKPVVSDAASGQYDKCIKEPNASPPEIPLDTSQTDLRLRRAYSTTVVLRNRRI
jgi:type IV pilus assembly protein PilW